MRHVILLTFLFLTGCAISEEKEIAMGRDAAPQFEREFGGLYPEPAVQNYVQEVGMELAANTRRPHLPWQFRVLNSQEVNAFALPGGFIYITRGLLDNLENEAQLASVLGHEVAHVAHRHSVQQIQRAQFAQGGALLAGIFVGGVAGDASNLVASLALMRYGRGQEREADLSGLNYLVREGYEPRAMIQTMEILEASSGGRGGGGLDFLSTHPSPGNRQEYLAEQIDKRYDAVATGGVTNEDRFEQIVRRRPDRDIVGREVIGQR
jgi:predicted Zn-dependent protease